MKILLFTLCGIYFNHMTEPALSELRNCYQRSATQKSMAEKFDHMVVMIDTNSLPVLIGYKGANEMIQAKYLFNPLSKLNRFNRGKAMLQMAVRRDTMNLETRFLRFTVQSNIPSILNYKDEINIDKQFLIAHTSKSNDDELRGMIFNYFIATNTLTETELKKIKN